MSRSWRHGAQRLQPVASRALSHPRFRLTGERGQALPLLALFLTAIMGLAAIAIDIGYARSVRAKAQLAADAAAMAGADDLPGGSGAVSDATAMATLNGFTTGGNITVTVHSPPTSGSHSGDTSSVEVDITESVPTFLAPILGIDHITATARAVATSTSTGGAPCALCVLDASAAKALDLTGSGSVTVTGSGIAVNSSAANAINLTGSGSITGTTIGVVGGSSKTGSGSFHPTPSTTTAVADPLANVPIPSVAGPTNGAYSLTGSGSATINPGIYSSISVTGSGTLTLNPGTYVLTGDMKSSGSGSIKAVGVTLYFTCAAYPTPCTTGQTGGGYKLTGSGAYDVEAPSSGTYQGLTIFYDRNNTASFQMSGSGSDDYTGTMYAKAAAATITGSGGVAQIDSLIVVDTATMTGSGSIDLAYTASQNYAVSGATGSSDLTE